MKRLFLFILLIFTISIYCFTSYGHEKVDTFTIFIDPGHGGRDGGASANGLVEKDLNLTISLKLRTILMEKGFIVKMTREEDCDLAVDRFIKKEDLRARVNMINESKANLFLSIHMNAFPQSSSHGAQVFYHKNNESNIYIANNIQNSLIEIMRNTTRKAKYIDTIYLLENLTIPGCLVECGFLSNKDDALFLQDDIYISKMCRAIYYGILDYLTKI